MTWACLDGSLQPTWMDYLTELIGKSKTLTLSNGEHLFLKVRNLKIIFETGSLQKASPASLLNCVSELRKMMFVLLLWFVFKYESLLRSSCMYITVDVTLHTCMIHL